MTYHSAAQRATQWVENQVEQDGSFRGVPQDIACYYKVPTLFLIQGREDLANRVLNHIQTAFMQPDGNFLSAKGIKSANPVFVEFWVYTNGWIVTGAERAGRLDISAPAWNYYKNYEVPRDVLSAAHLGLAALTMGDLAIAKQCGAFLQKMIARQDLKSGKFYLRVDADGNLVKNMPSEMAIFEHVDQVQPNQAYFMIGYPLAYLVKLYQATQDPQYISSAKAYFNWILDCTGNLRSFFFAHKVGWGASCYAEVTQDPQAIDLAKTIADYLVSIQEADGSFLSSADVLTRTDQTVEIAIWLTEIGNHFEPLD